MRALAVLLLTATAAFAATPEASYFAAKDKGTSLVVKYQQAENVEKSNAADKAALADMRKRLVRVIGPVAVPGFAKTPRLDIDSLLEGVATSHIDGLAFPASPPRGQGSKLVVTTRKLFEGWRRTQGASAEHARPSPEKLEDALRSDAFYNIALGDDAAFFRASEIELEKPAKADFVFAALGRWSQNLAPSALDRLIVAVVKGPRVLIADVAAAKPAPENEACAKAWNAAGEANAQLNAAYQKGGAKDEKLLDAYTKAQEKIDADLLACEALASKNGGAFPALRREAQDLAARLAGG